MATTWISAALPYIGGGVLGTTATCRLTWVRERRRTLDAYRAPCWEHRDSAMRLPPQVSVRTV